MTLTELKTSLHQKIDASDNVALLEQLYAVANQPDGVFLIPENMREGIRQGITDASKGRYHSWAEFEKKYQLALVCNEPLKSVGRL
ncbi:hypothetical protein [Mucilaginibacter sp.]